MQLANLMQYIRYQTRGRTPGPRTPRLPCSAACKLEDFAAPAVTTFLRETFRHDLDRFGDAFPIGREARHYWQTLMTARAFSEGGVLGRHADVLGVGTGNDPIVFWLTTQVGQVFATDSYLSTAQRASCVCPTMPVEPGGHWPGPWEPRRLVVQHMGTQVLHYTDESFDGVVAPHALEACTSDGEVERALEEMHRVLKVHGTLSLTAELILEGSADALGVTAFDEQSLRRKVLELLPWSLAGPLDVAVSAATRAAAASAKEFDRDLQQHLQRHGRLLWHELTWSRYPYLAIRRGATLSVPVHLTLRKTRRRD